MRKHFYSLWFQIIFAYFWINVSTFFAIGILLGTLISLVVIPRAMEPVNQLSRGMKAVSRGDYTVKLDDSRHKGELGDLMRDFNRMVRELNSTEIAG